MTVADAIKRRGLSSAPITPSTFNAPRGQNTDLKDETGMPGFNMHAFSWFRGKVSITPRVVNESARIAAFIGSDSFTQSLPAALKPEWTRR